MEDQESTKREQDLLFPSRIGKDEMNLIELPFTLLSTRNTTNRIMMERYWESKGEDGKTRRFYKKITGHPKLGLPTFQAEEVYIALMELSSRQDFEDVNVHTSRYELLRLMGWPTTGHYYRELIDILDQLLAVTITTNAFWDSAKKTYVTMGFGIIDGYQFFENARSGKKADSEQMPLPLGYITWNKFLFDSFKRGYIKTLNTEAYFGMTTRTAKRLYRYVDKHLHRGGSFEIDLFKLAFEKLEMASSYHHPSEIIRKLKPAIKEHNEKKIAKIKIAKSKTTPSGYKMVLRPILKSQMEVPQLDFQLDFQLDSSSKTEEQRYTERKLDTEAIGLADELQTRGVSKSQSEKLYKQYPDRIAEKLQTFDHLLEQRSPLIEKNPAGWLVKAIQEDYQPSEQQIKEKERRRKQQKADERKARWLQHREELIKQDVANWEEVPPEERITGVLGFWIAGEVMNGRQPTSEQIETKKQELIDNLPRTEEEKWEYIAPNYPEKPPDDLE